MLSNQFDNFCCRKDHWSRDPLTPATLTFLFPQFHPIFSLLSLARGVSQGGTSIHVTNRFSDASFLQNMPRIYLLADATVQVFYTQRPLTKSMQVFFFRPRHASQNILRSAAWKRNCLGLYENSLTTCAHATAYIHILASFI